MEIDIFMVKSSRPWETYLLSENNAAHEKALPGWKFLASDIYVLLQVKNNFCGWKITSAGEKQKVWTREGC